ncbi:MAG: ATP-binding protein [Lachnospiraceae bacterium]|nr:ATP-binding protein [Lachnospiraceae bacterium]
MDLNRLLLYRNLAHEDILSDIIWVFNRIEDNMSTREDVIEILCRAISNLIELSASHGYEGNLWHTYIAYLLAGNENAYSLACEMTGDIEGSINDVALNDLKIFKRLYGLDLRKLDNALEITCAGMLYDYKTGEARTRVINKRISEGICKLARKLGEAESAESFKECVTLFYKEFGVGKFGLHKAFRVKQGDMGPEIVPINNTAVVGLDDLVGYDIQKQKLIENTESFVKGRHANNCLLFGEAGTGKSTSIKAVLNLYYPQGLRMIELYKHQFKDLASILAQVKNRNYKFIIYMDDLSFEEFETEYKYLKAIIEGGLEVKPDNVLIYATSNRRHLIRERFSDKQEIDDDIHAKDTVSEKLSLAARFGVTIYFGSPDKKEYDSIIKALAQKNNVIMPEDELLAEAGKWELSHGGLSGRTAQQFIDYILGKAKEGI